MPKLTKRFVDSIVPDPHKPVKFWDDELRRFGVIVLPSGRRTYCIEYRNADHVQKRVKIGIHGHITAEEARNLARIKLGQVAHGEDVAQTSKQIRNLPTLIELAREYVNRHGQKKRPKSLQEDQRLLSNYILPALGPTKVATVTHQDIEKLHTRLGERPYQANRVVALLSKMFSLAVTWGLREDNPTRGIQKYQEEKRDRWLNEEELQRLWDALDAYPNHITAYFIKFLILTGARKGETLQASWDQIDLDKGIWRKPSDLTKQKKTEYLPLSDKALSILKELKKLSGKSKYIFPGHVDGQPMKEPKTFWRTVTKAEKLENVRIHDLRHTHASHLVSSGLSLSIVGKLLGHTQAATTQRYAHLADAPLRQAAEFFGEKTQRIQERNSAGKSPLS